MRYLLLILLCCIVALPSCRKCKEEPTPRPSEDANGFLNELPPATTTGEGTMGCLINGEVWLPRFEGTSLGWYDIDFSISGNGLLNLFANRQVHNNNLEAGSFALTGGNLISEGQYSSCNSNLSFYFGSASYDGAYHLTEDSTYLVTIERLDFDQQILSATFEATLIRSEAPFDTLHVTQGRFDLSGN